MLIYALKVWKKPKYNFLISKCLGFLYLYFDICTWHTKFIYIYRYGIYVSVFYLKQCVCEVLPARFSYYPQAGFVISPVRNLLLGLTPENFFEIWNFTRWVKQSTPGYWDRVCMWIKHFASYQAAKSHPHLEIRKMSEINRSTHQEVFCEKVVF